MGPPEPSAPTVPGPLLPAKGTELLLVHVLPLCPDLAPLHVASRVADPALAGPRAFGPSHPLPRPFTQRTVGPSGRPPVRVPRRSTVGGVGARVRRLKTAVLRLSARVGLVSSPVLWQSRPSCARAPTYRPPRSVGRRGGGRGGVGRWTEEERDLDPLVFGPRRPCRRSL